MIQFKAERIQYENRIKQLEADVQAEIKKRLQEGTEKDRDKLHATEKLRREMLKQIKQTKASILSLNDD